MEQHFNSDDMFNSKESQHPQEGGSAKMPPLELLALSDPSEREAAKQAIRELQKKGAEVDEGLSTLVEIETHQRYHAEQRELQAQLRDEIEQLRCNQQNINDFLNKLDNRLRSKLTVIAEDICEDFDIVRSLYKKLKPRDVPAKASLPDSFHQLNPPEMKGYIAKLLGDLKVLTADLWDEVLWRVEGKSEVGAWCPLISRQSARTAGLEQVLTQLESLSCRIDGYFRLGNSPLPEEVSAPIERERLHSSKRDLIRSRRQLKEVREESEKIAESLRISKGNAPQVSGRLSVTLADMCDTVLSLLKRCQVNRSTITKESKQTEAVIQSLRSRLSEGDNFQAAKNRSLARGILHEVAVISAWIDLTQSLGALETYDNPRGISNQQSHRIIGQHRRRQNTTELALGSGTGWAIPDFEQLLAARTASGFGSKVIKEAARANSDHRGCAPFHMRWMLERDYDRVLEIDKHDLGTPLSREDLGLYRKQAPGAPWIVEQEGAVVAFFVYQVYRGRIQVDKLVVDPAYRRQGIGFSIVEKLYNKLAEPYRRCIEIQARESNIEGQQFLRASGFRATAIVPNSFASPSEDAYVFKAYNEEIQQLKKLERSS